MFDIATQQSAQPALENCHEQMLRVGRLSSCPHDHTKLYIDLRPFSVELYSPASRHLPLGETSAEIGNGRLVRLVALVLPTLHPLREGGSWLVREYFKLVQPSSWVLGFHISLILAFPQSNVGRGMRLLKLDGNPFRRLLGIRQGCEIRPEKNDYPVARGFRGLHLHMSSAPNICSSFAQ